MILDCTLRDGGYYVDWDFDTLTVRKYLSAMAMAKVDIIEIGFRFLPSDKFLGAFAYSTDEYLKTINLPKDVHIAVMINAAEIISDKQCDIKKIVNQLFSKKEKSPVSIVRIAIHAKDIKHSYNIAYELKSLGYRVFINIMQINDIKDSEIVKIFSSIKKWNLVEVIYFADSFGCMDMYRVEQIVKIISTVWLGALGIHAHDNKGLALSNTLKARECGVKYLDATLCGMGRGAGNTKTEHLLVAMMQKGVKRYFPDALFSLALQEFGDLKDKYQWGENMYYFLSAVYGIHPTYIQEMLSGELYDTEQILSAINFLKKSKTPFYSFENMLTALIGVEGGGSGSWSATDWAKDKDVLILAPGLQTDRHIESITEYVKNRNPVVLCLNVNENISEDIVTAYVACHETRILIESDRYENLNSPIILPLGNIPDSIKVLLNNVDLFDFGLSIKKGKFIVKDNGCTLSSALSLFYAISIAIASSASRILLAGVDGYEASDPRYKEVALLFEQYSSFDESIPIFAITKTTYPIKQKSIYDPSI
jgi:4-hydroxy 2-oxovalerate aldolase